MDFYELEGYKTLEVALNEARRVKANVLILGVPGAGISFYLKKYLEKQREEGVGYITGPNEKVKPFTILDVDFDINENALEWVDQYLKEAGTEEKFAIVVNTPGVLSKPEWANSYLGRHIYKTFYFRWGDRAVVEQMANWLHVEVDKVSEEKVWKITGGLGRWVKYFLTNIDKINVPIQQLLEDEGLMRIVRPTTEVVRVCDSGLLIKLGVVINGEFGSELLREGLKQEVDKRALLDLKIGPDLVIAEEGKEGVRLLKVEADIVRFMLEHDGVIEKDKIADFKWGEGTYDKFSDQAINKAMHRLSKKLKIYGIETISGFGFKLVRK